MAGGEPCGEFAGVVCVVVFHDGVADASSDHSATDRFAYFGGCGDAIMTAATSASIAKLAYVQRSYIVDTDVKMILPEVI